MSADIISGVLDGERVGVQGPVYGREGATAGWIGENLDGHFVLLGSASGSICGHCVTRGRR